MSVPEKHLVLQLVKTLTGLAARPRSFELSLSASDYATGFGIPTGEAFSVIEHAARSLYQRSVVSEIACKRGLTRRREIRWLYAVKIDADAESVTLCLSPSCLEALGDSIWPALAGEAKHLLLTSVQTEESAG